MKEFMNSHHLRFNSNKSQEWTQNSPFLVYQDLSLSTASLSFNLLSLKCKFRSHPPECSTRGWHHPVECTCQTPGRSSSATGPSHSWTLSCCPPGCCSPSSGPLNKYSRVTKRIRLGIIGSAGCKLREHLKDMRGRLSDQFSSTDRHCNNKTKYFRLHLRLWPSRDLSQKYKDYEH